MYRSTLDCLAQTVRTEGVLALYKGWTPYVSRVMPHVLTMFVVYEKVLQVCAVRAQGGLVLTMAKIQQRSDVCGMSLLARF